MFTKMADLIYAFPTLDLAEGVEPWDVDKFLTWALTKHRGGSGAGHAIRFCLNLQSPRCDWAGYVLTAKCMQGLAAQMRREAREALAEDKRRTPTEEEIEKDVRERLGLVAPFNLGSALGVWDDSHVEVVRHYLKNPHALRV